MKLIYIYHSGFAIETGGVTIIIDFFRDSEGRKKGIVYDRLLKNSGKLYVLSSHAHKDHFNPVILKWKEIHPDIQYVFSKDILEDGGAAQSDAVFLNKFDVYRDENLTIKALGSTDIGISFLIKIHGKYIFHAGDLNNWHWKDESTEKEIRASEIAFLRELSDITKECDHIHIAMFPVDVHLGTDYMRGAEQFIDRVKVDYFAPMHFTENYESAEAFKPYAEAKGVCFLNWKHRGQEFVIESV